uniref:Uncharacterized protein n=1 Tax=Lepeophtheirus salmonis TaxID=72036 RepID=A0A0K2VJ86_LEPSM
MSSIPSIIDIKLSFFSL